MKLILFIFVVFCLIGSASAGTYYIETSDTTIDGDTFCGGTCDATDTIIIRAGARGSIWFKDFDGSGSYITIKNEDNASNEQVVITSSTQSAFLIEDCKYLDFKGDNDPDVYYGIKSINDGTPTSANNVRVLGQSDHINISYFEIAFDNNTDASGNGIFVQDATEDANWTWDGIHIHHNYIHDTRYAGMYLGQNDPALDDNNVPWISNVSIHDCIMEDMGAYGIGLKGVNSSSETCLIYNNTIRPSDPSSGNSTGLVWDDLDNSLHTGIGTSEYFGACYANVYNNTVIKTVGAGIRIGYENHNIYDNFVLGCGVGNNANYGHGIITRDQANSVHIYDNIIIQPVRYGAYALSGADASGTTLSRNLIGDAGIGEWGEEIGGQIIESGGADANTYYADVADFGFDVWSDDNNYSNDQFTFSAGTTANITSWENNDTNDNSLSITVDANQNVLFNATANQSIDTWEWDKDTVDQSHNHDNITLNWTAPGEKSVTVTATNTNGTSSAIEWTVTVENLGTWNLYKNLTINHSMVYEDLTNFSVLINITDSDLADHAQADGDDIIFKTSDGVTQLDHEQEIPFNKTTGVYLGWVRVPALNSTVNTTIRMYYNNSEAVNSENPTGVWDSNYKAVYHMSETPPGTIYDSTSNNNDATTSDMDSADQVTGQIDGALDFDEVNDHLYTGVDTSLDCGNNVTITTYHKRDDALIPATELQSLIVYRSGITSSQYSLYYNEDERLVSWIYDGTWHSFVGTTQVQDTDPHRADFVWNGTYALTYIDGAEDNAGAFSYTPNDYNEVLWVGADSYSANREFDGIGDETRISNTPRSAGWISTGWNNTEYPDLFFSIGAEQSEGAPDTKFEYWDGAAWQENPEDYHLWFECFWITSGYPDGVAPNAEQSGSQHSLKITNNGTAAGIPKMKFNESSPAEVTVYVDDDYTVAGAVAITDTYQAVGSSLGAGENVTLSAWVNLTGLTSIWEFETEVIVE